MVTFLFIAATVIGCIKDPPCDGITHSNLSVDTTEDVPVFNWEGDNSSDLYVSDANDDTVWNLTCDCKANEESQGNECRDNDEEDWEYRACLAPPIRFGEKPDTPRLDSMIYEPAEELEAGQEYLVKIMTFCHDEEQDANSAVEAKESFIAP